MHEQLLQSVAHFYMEEELKNIVNESHVQYGFQTISEEGKLKIDMQRSDIEKFRLFTKMLRRNNLLNKVTTDVSPKQ